MTPEQVKEVIRLQEEIDELERIGSRGIGVLVKHILSGRFSDYRCSWFSEAREIPSFLEDRIHEVIADEIEARKIMLADLGSEEYGNQ